MAVFRLDNTHDYTVMSNHHLRNTSLSPGKGPGLGRVWFNNLSIAIKSSLILNCLLWFPVADIFYTVIYNTIF